MYVFKKIILGEDGEEESPNEKDIKEIPSVVEKDHDRPLKESDLQSENQTAQEEKNQSIQSPPVLSSQMSIPLD